MYKRIAKSFARSVILVALVFFMLGDDCNVSGTSCIYCGGNGQKLEFKDCPLCTNGLISGTNPVGEKVFYWCTDCNGTGGERSVMDCPHCVDGVVP